MRLVHGWLAPSSATSAAARDRRRHPVPSAFAHALVGASLASALPAKRRIAGFGGVLAALAAAPDLDVVAFRFGIPYEHPLGHRGVTHSLPFAMLLGALSWPLWRRVLPDGAGSAAALTALAIRVHGILDAFTDAGLAWGSCFPSTTAATSHPGARS